MRISDWSSDVCSSDLTVTVRLPVARAQRRIQRRQQAIDRAGVGARKRLGHQRLHPDAIRMQGQAGRAREDQQLAAHVLAGQVDPRIWLGVAGIARLSHEIRERPLAVVAAEQPAQRRSEEHTSELQSLMRISYAVFCLKKKINTKK